jgi:formylglycine-generating enzyme required for sulfatase activity
MSTARFVEALAQDCDLDAREIADLLWLVAHPPVAEHAAAEPIADRDEDVAPPIDRIDSESEPVETSAPEPLPPVDSESEPVETSAPEPLPPVDSESEPSADLATESLRGELPVSTQNIRVPDPDVLDETLSLVRALRPLLQQVEAGWARGIDEVATVDRIAETGVWSPILQPDFEPWLEVAIAIDVSASMTLWRRLLDELRRLLSCYGGFRDLRVWELQPKGDGIYLRSPSSEALLDPNVLRSTDRRRLTIVFSDCTADYWWDGRMQPVLRRWGETMPVAIWQMLPDWMWKQTALGLGEYVTLRNAKRGATNAQLQPKFLSLRPFARVRRSAGRQDEGGVARPEAPTACVSVVGTQADSLAAWSRMVAGDRQSGVPGFVLPAVGWQPRDPDADLDLDERLARFMRRSTPEARRLMALLSAAPVITLPVMRLIRAASPLLSSSGASPQPIAEVFVSGVLAPQGQADDPELVEYEFRGELRDRLLAALPKVDAREVFDQVSRYVAERLGRTMTEFKALLVSPEFRDEADRLGLRSFAQVSAQVLRRLGAEYEDFARALEQGETPPGDVGGGIQLEEFESEVAVFERDNTLQLEAFEYESVETIGVLKQFEFEIATIAIEETITRRDGLGRKVERQPVITRRRGSNWGYTEKLSEEIGLDMMSIPGGTFLRGSPDDEPERMDRESPQHEVTVSPFFMGRYAITQAQWRTVASYPQIDRELDPDPAHFKGENRPVEQVSWDDVTEFCQRLSAKTGKVYRLPSEAEWEYACRAGTTTPFHFGDWPSVALMNYNGNLAYNDSPRGEYRKQTVEVGSFPSNSFGLYDMHGNVWEWCEDDWHDSYQGAPTDGSAWLKENRTKKGRLLRGGSWSSLPGYCRSACRNLNSRDGRLFNFGFRVLCVSPRTLGSQNRRMGMRWVCVEEFRPVPVM